MVAKGGKGEKFPAHFEMMERFSIWVRITEIHTFVKSDKIFNTKIEP